MATILERNKNIKPKQKTREEHAEDALYREVWEEVNNEKTVRFIKKYSRVIIGAALVLMIAVTAVQIGIRHVRDAKMARAANYEAALISGDVNALTAIGMSGKGAISDLALFQAYVLTDNIELAEKLARDGKTRDLRDLARMHVVAARGDDMTAADVEKYLSPLNTKSSPYYYSSRLTVARKYLATGDAANANKILDKIIADKDAPAVISATAQTLR